MTTATSYLGLRLPHPFMAGASPFGHRLDTVRRLEDAGCAAVVLHSLFEEQLTAASDGRIRHMDPADTASRRRWRDSRKAKTIRSGPTRTRNTSVA